MPNPASYTVRPVFLGLTIPTAAFWLHHLMPLSLCDCITTTTSWFISATFISSNYRIWNITILLSKTSNISQILIRSSMTFLLESATSTGTSAPLVLLRRQSCLWSVLPTPAGVHCLLFVPYWCTLPRYCDRQTELERETHTHTETQSQRQGDRHRDRATEREGGRDTHTHRETYREKQSSRLRSVTLHLTVGCIWVPLIGFQSYLLLSSLYLPEILHVINVILLIILGNMCYY